MFGNVSLRLQVDEFRSMRLMPTLTHLTQIYLQPINHPNKNNNFATCLYFVISAAVVEFVYLPLPDNAERKCGVKLVMTPVSQTSPFQKVDFKIKRVYFIF